MKPNRREIGELGLRTEDEAGRFFGTVGNLLENYWFLDSFGAGLVLMRGWDEEVGDRCGKYGVGRASWCGGWHNRDLTNLDLCRRLLHK